MAGDRWCRTGFRAVATRPLLGVGPGLFDLGLAGFAGQPRRLQALTATLISTILATALAVLMAGAIAMLVYPGRVWQRLQLRLPLLLSVPHAAFAVGLFFLLAPSGWLARGLAQLLGWASPPGWVTVQDPFGLSLALALAIKESWFLLWVFGAVLGEQVVARQMTIACSLGYAGAGRGAIFSGRSCCRAWAGRWRRCLLMGCRWSIWRSFWGRRIRRPLPFSPGTG